MNRSVSLTVCVLAASCAMLVAGWNAFSRAQTTPDPPATSSARMARFQLDNYFKAQGFVPDSVKGPPEYVRPGYGLVHQRWVRQGEVVDYKVTVAPDAKSAAWEDWDLGRRSQMPWQSTATAPLKNGVRRADHSRYLMWGGAKTGTYNTTLVGRVYFSFMAVHLHERPSAKFPIVVRDVQQKLLAAARLANAS